jgi:thiamine-monophosphate kinase
MTQQPLHTDISAVGEFGLIDRIRKIVDIHIDDRTIHNQLLTGIGDDAAAFTPGSGNLQLLTTDALVESVHFDLTYTSLKHLGWKSMAANISDIAAMGGVPRYATISLALPKRISVEMVEAFYTGAAAAAMKYSFLIVGGDTVAAADAMMVSVAMTGEVPRDKIIHRRGAVPGDYLCVTGHLGGAVAGLIVLGREKERFQNSEEPESFRPNLEPYREVIARHLMPHPRLDLSKILANEVKVHAMIDISDGLASEVHHLCTGGNVGAEIHEHNLPVIASTQAVAREASVPVSEYCLYGGEEYELLFAISEEEYKKLEPLTNDVTIVGRVLEASKGIRLVKEQGENEPLGAGGWNHFRQSPPDSR